MSPFQHTAIHVSQYTIKKDGEWLDVLGKSFWWYENYQNHHQLMLPMQFYSKARTIARSWKLICSFFQVLLICLKLTLFQTSTFLLVIFNTGFASEVFRYHLKLFCIDSKIWFLMLRNGIFFKLHGILFREYKKYICIRFTDGVCWFWFDVLICPKSNPWESTHL